MNAAESDFTRTTRAAAARHLPSDFATALEAHAEAVGASWRPDAARLVAVTESEPRSRGFLRRRRAHSTWILLGDEALAVVSDAAGRPVASLYRLDGLEAKPYSSPLVADEGLDVIAMPVGGSERVSVFLPLADGAVRDELLAALRG